MMKPNISTLAFSLAVAVLALACQRPLGPEKGPALLAYIANAGSNHVQVVDLATGETLRKIYSGATPWRLVLSPDGRELWVQHWSAETTAVVGLEDHEVRSTVPIRGPGLFDAAGARFLSFGWPGSALSVYDTTTMAEIEERVTEVSRVYDLALDDAGENLFLVQYDPISRGQTQRYAYLVNLPLTAEEPQPSSIPTGRSPIEVLPVRGQPFVLTADNEAGDGTAGGLTLLNLHGDGRRVPTCPAPRQLIADEDATRLVVLCWDRDEGRHGHVVSYRTDFAKRPWPELVEEAAVEIDAGLVAGMLVSGGERIIVLDQPGRRLLELDAATLDVKREMATGDVPADVAVVEVPAAWRDRAKEKGPARRRAEEAIARLRDNGTAFPGLRWSEAIFWDEPEENAEAGEEDDPLPPMIGRERRLDLELAAPARLRRRASDDTLSPSGDQGGKTLSLMVDAWSLAVRRDGRFWTAPRQELASLVYALPNFEFEEAVRRLAGDVPGSPFLSGGLALDLSTEIVEDGRRYLLIGGLKPDRAVAQLWIDVENGRPTNLVEKFPVGEAGGHAEASIGRFVETKFLDFVTLDGGVILPSRLERRLDGRWVQQVSIEDAAVVATPRLEDFDPRRLAFGGNNVPTPALQAAEGNGIGPGLPVAVMDEGYLDNPWAEHAAYTTSPPTSGPRLRSLADWGVHAVPVPPALQVHNLEHGGVVVQYRCDGDCSDLAAELERLTSPYSRVIVAPYPYMKSRIALTAWGRIETLDAVDADRIVAFLEAWEGHHHHELRTGS